MTTRPPGKECGRTDQARPEMIMEKVYGIIPGLALLAGLELDIFSLLGEQAADAQSLATSMDVSQNRLLPLLNTLTVSGLLIQDGGKYSNRPETIDFLVRNRSGYHCHILRLILKILEVVPQTAQTILQDSPQAKMDWTGLTHNQKQSLQKGQYHGSVQAGKELGTELDLSYARTVLDGAGGTGGLSVGLVRKWPDLHITVTDLPQMARACRERISSLGLSHRITVADTDLVRRPPPGRFDTAILRSFLQVLSPADVQAVLRHIRSALNPGGRVCIIGYFVDDTRLFPANAAAHNLVFLNLYEHGRAYTEGKYRSWLLGAGFSGIKVRYDVFSDGTGMIMACRN